MSLILDALNRADRERSEQNQAPILHNSTPAPAQRHRHIIRWVVEALVLIAAACGIYWYSQSGTGSKSEPVSEPSQQTVATTVTTIKPNPEAAPKPTPTTAQTNKEATTTPREQHTTSQAISSLYQQQAKAVANRVEPPVKKNGNGTANIKTASQKARDTSTASTMLNEPQSTQQALTKKGARTATANIKKITQPDLGLTIFQQMPLLEQMPARFRQTVPSIEYSVHVYSDKSDAGFVTLNGRKHRVGGKVTPELIVIKILEDSVVLDYHDTQFRLSALNSWVNFN